MTNQDPELNPLSAAEYDKLWSSCDDFIKYNPGARHRRRHILSLLKTIQFQTVLDVGCGNGEISKLVKDHYPDIELTGGDLSSAVIEGNRVQYPKSKFRVLDIEKNFLPERFDLIICSEVIEHLNQQMKAIYHLSQMLNKGGHLLLTCPTGKIFSTEKHFGHIRHPKLAELQDWAMANELMSCKAITWGWPFYFLTKWATNLYPNWSINNFANGAYSSKSKLISGLIYYLNFANLKHRVGCQLFLLFKKA